ncbi:MAG: Na+/H+ antiporter NhaC family protein [Sphaerochaetaceae bacterium]
MTLVLWQLPNRYHETTGSLYNIAYGDAPGEIGEMNDNERAKAIDMLVPIIVLVVTAVVFFPVTTWMMGVDGESVLNMKQSISSMSFGEAFANTDASYALFYSVIFTLTISYVYYFARKLLTIKEASEALKDGIASMVPALMILTMAWSIGTIIKESPADGGLGLATFLSDTVVAGGFPLALVPMIVFALSSLIAFSTGTSWGTFAIMIPITMPIIAGLATSKGMDISSMTHAMLLGVSAVLGGAVFGDHASPISDTTILSSTGAACPHLEHVATQMPYSLFIAIASLVGFLFGGLFLNALVAWIASAVVFIAGIILLPRYYR